MKDFFDSLIQMIKDNPILIFMLFLGCVSPGVLSIALFEWEVFLEMDIVKMLIFGCSLTIPSINLLFLFVRIHEKYKNPPDIQGDFLVSLAFNAVVWGVALLIKVFDMETSIREFIVWLIIGLSVASFTLWFDYKKNVLKNENDSKRMEKEDSTK